MLDQNRPGCRARVGNFPLAGSAGEAEGATR